tara:strand:+ start:205 stop:450 length:246 start_codon:yes stop_codon:yes gene_type:complete
MATYSFNSIKQQFHRDFTGHLNTDKIIDNTISSAIGIANWAGKNADTILLGATAFLIGDVAESLDNLETLQAYDMYLDGDI